MSLAGEFSNLFAEVQEGCNRRHWSRAVELSRASLFLSEKKSEEQWEVRVVREGQVLSPRVRLWPGEVDWQCDCRDPEDPCVHVAAALIAQRHGLWRSAESETSPLPQAGEVVYRWRRAEDCLVLERVLDFGTEELRLNESLAGFMAGMQSGRLPMRAVAVTKTDFAIDHILKDERGAIVARGILEKILPLLEKVARHEFSGQNLQVIRSARPTKVNVVQENSQYRIQVEDEVPEDGQVFANGLRLQGTRLGLSSGDNQPWLARLREWHKRLLSREEVYELLMSLRNLGSERLVMIYQGWSGPEWVDLPPELEFSSEVKNDEIEVRADIIYGEPPIARILGNRLQLLGGPRWPIRDLKAEQKLALDLRHQLHVPVGQWVRFQGDDAHSFLRKIQHWPSRHTAPANQAFEAAVAPIPGVDSWRLAWGDGGNEGWQIRVEGKSLGMSSDKTIGFAFDQLLKLADSGRTTVFSPELGSWLPIPTAWLKTQEAVVREILHLRQRGALARPVGMLMAAELAEDLGLELSPGIRRLREESLQANLPADFVLPSDLKAELRPYQRAGFQWLKWRQQRQLGAILADDMGLGKTLQALSVFSGRTLVVAPTSVLQQWCSELTRFRPHLRLCLYHGSARAWDAEAAVVVTSFHLLRQEVERFVAEEWDNIILDEAQNIKNMRSQIAQVAHQLRGNFRLALSGTPVENRWSELWSLFQFVNPGLLGPLADFEKSLGSEIGRAKVRRRLRPFILRREKGQVAQDLPTKTEILLEVSLNETERQIYEALFLLTRRDFLDKYAEGVGVVGLLETLLRLRQACCHPGLLPGQGKGLHSTKVEVLVEHLENAVLDGHRALVFSQWTGFLDLIGKSLQENGISYLRIDGSTRHRELVVEKFQVDREAPVMLISLKAGGVGLNLTAADYVFIMDPWWNPAAEIQAADRAHRIGQQNPVCVYKLIASGTIEQNILALQDRKRTLLREVLDGTDGLQSLTREDLRALLEPFSSS